MRYKLFILLILSTFNAWTTTHHPQAFLNEISGEPDEGMKIVQHYCATCHAAKPMIQLGAPKIGDNNDWRPRIKLGLEHLVKHAEEGFNAMPARGGCFECSDEQFFLAILAMLPESERSALLLELKQKSDQKQSK